MSHTIKAVVGFVICVAALVCAMLLISGFSIVPKTWKYQQVVEELNEKYGANLSVDLKNTGALTPEELRTHLEGLITAHQTETVLG